MVKKRGTYKIGIFTTEWSRSNIVLALDGAALKSSALQLHNSPIHNILNSILYGIGWKIDVSIGQFLYTLIFAKFVILWGELY